MDQAEAKRRFARYCELSDKQERTQAETMEMDRLLYQVGGFIAEKDGSTKEQYLHSRRATAEFHKRARGCGVSEAAFVIGGIAAGFFANGESETYFLECYRHFDDDHGRLNLAVNELKEAGLWPW